MSISCSRRFTSSRAHCARPCAAGCSPEKGLVELPGINLTHEEIRNINKVVMIACGTAYHASIGGKYAIEELCRIPVEVDVASELRYRDPIIDEHTLGIVISQSGETLDTIVGLREVKSQGRKGDMRSPMWSGAWPRVNRMACCIPMPGRRSRSPAPRRIPPS